LIAHISAIFLLPAFEKSAVFCDFRQIAQNIGPGEGLLSGYGWKKDSRGQHDVLVPLATPSGVTTGPEFCVFGHTPPKMGSSARPYPPRRWVLFPPQNYPAKVSARPFGPRHLPFSSPFQRWSWEAYQRSTEQDVSVRSGADLASQGHRSVTMTT